MSFFVLHTSAQTCTCTFVFISTYTLHPHTYKAFAVYIFSTNIFHFISMILNHRFSSYYWEPCLVDCQSWVYVTGSHEIAGLDWPWSWQFLLSQSPTCWEYRWVAPNPGTSISEGTDVGTRQDLSDSNLAEYFFKCVFWSISSIFYLTILKNNFAWKQKGMFQDAHYNIVRKWKPGNSQVVTGREKQATNETLDTDSCQH